MFFSLALGLLSVTGVSAQRQLTINAKPGAPIQPTMYGIFFEDINFGADGGLYAEMVENRSFEFPQRLMGWNTFGNVTVSDVKPAFDRNPHYVVLESAGHDQKFSGLENRGFFGMGLKKGMTYNFSVYARLHDLQGKEAKIRVELVDDQDKPIDKQEITITNNKWAKKTVTLTSNKTVEKGLMRVFLESADGVDLDHVSLFPADNWHGLRADLVNWKISIPVSSASPADVSSRALIWLHAISGRTVSGRQRTVLSMRTAGTIPSRIVSIPTITKPMALASMSSSCCRRRLVQSRCQC